MTPSTGKDNHHTIYRQLRYHHKALRQFHQTQHTVYT